jgi:maltose O-acetyltransferase
MPSRTGNPLRPVAAVAFWTVGRNLPWSTRPLGGIAKRIRGRLASVMIDDCGTNVNVERGAWFGSGRGISLGDNSAIGLDCLIIGPVALGRNVMMGPRCVLLASRHTTADVTRPMNSQGFDEDAPIVIGDDVWIGANVTILAGRTIGSGVVIGAGSVVTHDIPDLEVWAGNPARRIRSRLPA